MRSRRYFKKLTRLIRIFCIGSHWDAQYTTHEVLGYIHKSGSIQFGNLAERAGYRAGERTAAGQSRLRADQPAGVNRQTALAGSRAKCRDGRRGGAVFTGDAGGSGGVLAIEDGQNSMAQTS
jgi:hypothetical protein